MPPQTKTSNSSAGVLYIIATPIGNPDDLSPRAIKTLAAVDLIACEDTRRTGQLLAAHQIRTPMRSYYEHVEERRTAELVERLKSGASIALVTDAGTPAISDPGFRLVRATLDAGIHVTSVPGPSAAIAALCVSGIATNRFTFEGFLPARDSSRRKALNTLKSEPRTMIFFEAARRVAGTLAEMASVMGADRNAALIREITKTHEETIRGQLAELVDHFRAKQALGEITIVVEGARSAPETTPSDSARLTVAMLTEAGMSLKDASALVARVTGRQRREVYQDAIKSRRNHDTR